MSDLPTSSAAETVAAPKTGYVLLWFPLASETFVFREIQRLAEEHVPVRVYTMYAGRMRGCAEEMRHCALPILRFGIRRLPAAVAAFWKEARRRPCLVWNLVREGLLRRMRSWETRGETLLCFFLGFLLAREAEADGIQLLHAAWAGGPATAAWVASRLTGIPFSFTGRAGDIHPQDGILAVKARDALFIRANNGANVPYLQGFCPEDGRGKVRLVYNGLTLGRSVPCLAPFRREDLRLLSIGRFVPKKGFSFLLSALARLRREGLSVRLTLVGDGRLRWALEAQCRRMGLEDAVDMPGFVPNDQVHSLMRGHDVFVIPCVESSTGDRDGIPNVIMEALSCRMPVVATDVCGIGEVVEDGVTGLLVPQRDPRALADALRRMLSDRDEALRMAENGHRRVLEMFDGGRNARILAAWYAEAVRTASGTEAGPTAEAGRP